MERVNLFPLPNVKRNPDAKGYCYIHICEGMKGHLVVRNISVMIMVIFGEHESKRLR